MAKNKTSSPKPATESGTRTLSLRAEDDLAARILAVATQSRRKPAAVLKICVEDHLPALEKALGIKPPPEGNNKKVTI